MSRKVNFLYWYLHIRSVLGTNAVNIWHRIMCCTYFIIAACLINSVYICHTYFMQLRTKRLIKLCLQICDDQCRTWTRCAVAARRRCCHGPSTACPGNTPPRPGYSLPLLPAYWVCYRPRAVACVPSFFLGGGRGGDLADSVYVSGRLVGNPEC